MSGDNLTDEVSKERAVLGDVTNTLAVHLESRKRMLLLLQRIMHQKLRRGFSDQKLFGSYDASRDSCISRGTLPTCSEGNSQDGDDKEVIGSNPGLKGLVSQVFDSENKDIGFGRFAANKYGSVEWSRLQNAQDSKSFELEKCTGLRGNACVNLEAADDLLKACSFCLKAAYIWSDLRYQDIKGRISVVKRRKKETSILVSKMGRGKQSDIHHGQGSSKSSTNLVSDLTNQRRSLFLQMEDIFAHESDQL
ncbi:putative Tether containing UBX domain for GLUT4 [Tripterygium wilfordii]|uniref:Putative Tether containing UBX domain for GLUT4 n=1 Tax=Tripterygium wilfordii TaxID=458696 RepID=A0A7J7DU26_TRIWF|nr:putative Tether containing UBX domain for GLUT4 [Tripterygium wilfordii]